MIMTRKGFKLTLLVIAVAFFSLVGVILAGLRGL